MKLDEIAKKYNINSTKFLVFMRNNNLPFSESFWGDKVVDDKAVESYVSMYLEETKDERAMQAALKAEEDRRKEAILAEEARESARKKKAMANMLITSGFNFDGYRITKYSGYISGDDAMSVDRGAGFLGFATSDAKDGLMASLSQIRRNALRELKEAAYELGCNAVIGVDFDYITLDPQTATITGGTQYQPYVFCVTANGNAVVIEKIEE